MARKAALEVLAHQEKVAAQRADDDLRLWGEWHAGGRTPELLQPLMHRYNGLLERKTQEWRAPAVAPAAFKAELMRHFIDAAHTFDPQRGAAFNTHLQTRLQKAQRYNTRYQNVGYIPEGRARLIGPMDRAENQLVDELGRTPTLGEIAGKMGVPEGQVASLRKARKKDVPASQFETDPSAFGNTRENEVVRLMQHSPADYLNPQEAQVFEHIYGVNGKKKITDTTTLASQLGLSQPKISRLKTQIATKIRGNL